MMQSIQLDKSGVSTSGSGGGAYSSDRRSSSSQDHFSSHGPPSSAGGSNTMMSTGKKKTDQVVLEFLYKTVEVVLLSRAYFQPSTPRRARFNLDIQELPHVRDLMRPCRDNVNEPVVLDIAMGSMLLERWQISYTNGMQSHSPLDVINQLREVCRRIGILLRSVYCLARILPAFPVSDRLKAQQEDLGHPVAGLEFEVASSDHAMQRQFESDQPKQRYSFIPIDTPFGTLQLSVLYRKRNDDLLSTIQSMCRLEPSSTQSSLQHCAHHHDSGDANDDDEDDHPRTSLQMSSTLTHAIIQDYVPTSAHTTPTSSPHLHPSAPPVSHMSPIPAVSQAPLVRSSPMQIVHDVPNTLQGTFSGETVFGLSSQGRASGGTDMDSSSGLVDDQLCLPFATSSSSLSSTAGSSHDVMTVSAFLHELKQAPPLHPSIGRAAGRSSLAEVEGDLAFFKQLRDQLEG
ncbi:hypothetical protein DYB25_003635 [Aphanomyces astaci]|uniref:Autophagy-related protein 13 N-terminal domain-containing protein n=1 Tax=Aphanomyces astaci TaxID=112090 RepID=A0A397EQG2_APHAT|nr:hypothetical protein DYB25_003635 [Aphanomyces astaci]RHY87893.1 hypothetical protein DYB26_009542 [Aphanomyces astaci]RHZ00713.1 hypothetical protein DYB31_012899 [Aphanomyces astaci]